MRILHVAVTLERRRGGTAQAVLSLARSLREADIDAEVAAVEFPGNGAPMLSDDYPDVPIHLLRGGRIARFTPSRPFREWIFEHVADYDLVEIHEIFAFPPIYAHRAATQHGVPYILNTHNGLNPRDLRKRALLKAVFRRPVLRPILRDAARLKAATQLECDEMNTYGIPTARVIVPLPVEPIEPSGDSQRFRRRYGIAPDATVGLFVGRFDGQKGLDLLIPTWGAAVRENPHLHLALVGAGSKAFEADMRQWIRQSGIEGGTAMPGFLSGLDRSDAFAAADFYIQLSWHENFSYTVAQAMAAGLPCLVTDRIGVSADVRACNGGLVCPAEKPAAIQALRELLARRLEWKAMGDRARTHFAAHLSIGANTHRVVELYREVIAEPSKRRRSRAALAARQPRQTSRP